MPLQLMALKSLSRMHMQVRFTFTLLAIFLFAPGAFAKSLSTQPENAVKGSKHFEKIRAVSLGGWLVVEKWIKPSLFDGISNADLLDGARIQLKSARFGTYLSAEGGGGQKLVANRASASIWETFKLWRVSSTRYQFRVYSNQFVSAKDGYLAATKTSPGKWETFTIERFPHSPNRVHIRAFNGMYLQAKEQSQVTADYAGVPGWSDNNPAIFDMNVTTLLAGEYQLANGFGPSKATQVFKNHWNTYIKEEDFKFLAANKINAVRVPVGWWIMYNRTPPRPFVAGSLQLLDKAFTWGKKYNIKIIVDLHAAPGSQNQFEHSGNRDGISDWTRSDNIKLTLKVIDFIASRYSNNAALLGIELLNEPATEDVPLSILNSYYKNGYQTVRKYSRDAYVIICQRIGSNPSELVNLMKPSSGYSNVVLDVHYYNLFEDRFKHFSAQDNIDYVNKQRKQAVQSLNKAGGAKIFVGEWTNEWSVINGSETDNTKYANAQLNVFGEASFGWSFWSMKNQNLHWDFQRSLRKFNRKWPSS